MLKKLSIIDQDTLVSILKDRFLANKHRHSSITWEEVYKILLNNPEKMSSLALMEETGGEPDVVGCSPNKDEIIFFDCAIESPTGRRSLCYDHAALESRKANKPADSALTVAKTMGIQVLDEEQYQYLQTLGHFDNKTSSWLLTPDNVRSLGGAIFGDYRFGRVFIYHNGAESYYAARGFRGCIKI